MEHNHPAMLLWPIICIDWVFILIKVNGRKKVFGMISSLGNAIVRYPTSFGVWA